MHTDDGIPFTENQKRHTDVTDEDMVYANLLKKGRIFVNFILFFILF